MPARKHETGRIPGTPRALTVGNAAAAVSAASIMERLARVRAVAGVAQEASLCLGSMLRELRGMPPAERRAKLRTQEVINEIGARLASRMARDLDLKELRLLEETPSSIWKDDAFVRGVEFPPGGEKTSMVMSVISGRYTPPQMLEFEDQLDAWSPNEAFNKTRNWGRSTTAAQLTMLREGRKDQKLQRRSTHLKDAPPKRAAGDVQ